MIYNLTKYNAHWDTCKLRSLGNFSRGKSTHRPRNDSVLYVGGGYPFIQTGDIKAAALYINSHEQEYNETGLAQSKLWATGTLAITIAANIAETGILSYSMCFPDSVVGFTAYATKTSELYMYYIFAFIRDSIQKSIGGSIQDNINIDYLENLDFKIPDKKTQDNIAKVLSALDRKIALNNAIHFELEKVERTLYDYWFTQFDFPDENGKPYRTSGGAMVWSEELKREIPKGWNVKPIKQCVVKISTGLNPRQNFVLGRGSNRYVTIKNIENGHLDFSKCDFVDDKALAKIHARSDIEVGDILFTSIEPIGRLYLINEPPVDWDINESVFSIRTDESVMPKEYLYPTLNSDLFRAQTAPLKTGSVQKGIRIGALESMKIIIPDTDTMRKFAEQLKPIYKAHGLREKENKDLIALRDFLLPLLMNGQVRVGVEEVSEKPLTKQRSVFKRLVLSAYILDNICDEPTAGRVKFEKLLYLSEYCAEIDLHSDFHRHAAGPYDPKALYSIEEQLKKNKWFGRNKDKAQSRAYVRLEQSDGYKPYVEINFKGKQKSLIGKLIHLFKNARTIQCEIVATLYGAWNDFLIEGVQPTDDQIVNEVLTNWHERKERIDRQRWLDALGWMRQNKIIPVGYGRSTKRG